MSAPQFQKATRQQVKLKIGVAGPSGAGKTLGALAMAHALAQGGKIAVIDTERGSASLYADRYQFDTLEIEPPYLSSKYLEAIAAAAEAGYVVVVVDSISHQWDGDGGILQRKEQADCVPGSNHFANWGPFTKEHNEFRSGLLNAPIHVVVTMRSKQAYQQSESGNKKKIEKLGLAPIQREGMEYEFTLVFDVQMDHRADASKDRTDLFTGKRTDLLDPKTGKRLLDWLGSAAPLAPKPAAPPQLTVTDGGKKPEGGTTGKVGPDTLLPFGKHKGVPMGGLTDEYLAHIVKLGAKLPDVWITAAQEELERRRFQRLDLEEADAEKEKPADSRPMTQADLLEGEGKPPVTLPAGLDQMPDALRSVDDDGLPF